MSNTTDESDDDTLSRNHSELSLTDDGSPGDMAGTGVVLKKGPWTAVEDAILVEYVKKHGEGNWNAVQKHSGLFRCGKSCRLRWANHLRPNLKKGTFTVDEERVIIELHAKMGNKWARMAAHLPGRTDNEIKNYWNTRIKRRQRAGLPLYPKEMCLAMQDNQSHNSSGFHSGEKGQNGPLQSNDYDIPDYVRSVLQTNQELLSYIPQHPNIHSGRQFVKSPTSSQYCNFLPPALHRQKRFRQSPPRLPGYDSNVSLGIPQFEQIQDNQPSNIEDSFRFSVPHDPDPNRMYHPFGITQDSHSLNNGNFSASKLSPGSMKSELPSLQYAEADLGSWGPCPTAESLPESVDAFLQSPPPTGALKYECSSPRSSGLLEALLYQANTTGNVSNRSSDTVSYSFTAAPCDLASHNPTQSLGYSEQERYHESTPFICMESEPSIVSECTPISGAGIPLDEQKPAEAFLGQFVKSEPVDDQVSSPDKDKDEAFPSSKWFEEENSREKEESIMTDPDTDAIAALLAGHDLELDSIWE